MSTGKGKKTCTEFRHVRRYKQGSHTHTPSVFMLQGFKVYAHSPSGLQEVSKTSENTLPCYRKLFREVENSTAL